MSDAGLLPLIMRMVVSLGAVLAVIAIAFAIARRRVNGGATVSRSLRGRSRRRTQAPPIEVVGRAGLTKGSVAVALRFGERIVLVGVSEQAPTTVLQEMEATKWDEWNEHDEELEPIPTPSVNDSIITPRPTFLEALREATTRRA